MGMVEIIGGVERRRRWSVEEKLAIPAEADLAGATVSGTARRHDLHPNQVFKWRRDARLGHLGASPTGVGARHPLAMAGEAGFARAAVAAEVCAVRNGGHNDLVEVMLSNGRLVRLRENIDPWRLARLISALDER